MGKKPKVNMEEEYIDRAGTLYRCKICEDQKFLTLSRIRQHCARSVHLESVKLYKAQQKKDKFTNGPFSCLLWGSQPNSLGLLEDQGTGREDSHQITLRDIQVTNCHESQDMPLFSAGHDFEEVLHSELEEFLDGIPSSDTDSDERYDISEDSSCDSEDEQSRDTKSNYNDIAQNDPDWFPYPNKGMFLTDLLFNSPRLRFSTLQKKAILQYARSMQNQQIPSLYALEKIQTQLAHEIGNPTSRQVSTLGNVYYMNDIASSIAKDLGNPIVRPHLRFYPEDHNGQISQLLHARKLLQEVPEDMLTPMIKHPQSLEHYYIGELSKCTDGSFFIPEKWFKKRSDGIWMSGHQAWETPAGFAVDRMERVETPAIRLAVPYPKLVTSRVNNILFCDSSSFYQSRMPHPLRAMAHGRPIYSIPIIVFEDDASGNVSKQWNKHIVCYMSNGALPHEEIEKEFNVRFVAASPHVGPLEIMQGFKLSYEKTFVDPREAYDCVEGENCLVQVYPVMFVSDNPMQSEQCSHAGLLSNKFCPTCHVGGTKEYKRSDVGYLELFKPGIPRTVGDTLTHLAAQFSRALKMNAKTAIERLVRESGIKDSLSQSLLHHLLHLSDTLKTTQQNLTASEMENQLTVALANHINQNGDSKNPLLSMRGVDIHQDTPVEILHTVLLGVVKYFWIQTSRILKENKLLATFTARLRSVSTSGLPVSNLMADYMVQYRGSLVGKHFKILAQVMPFVVFDLVQENVLRAWLAIGRLLVCVWQTDIEDIELYIMELEALIAKFLDIASQCSPGLIVSKPKMHFLTHLPEYIRRFGPAVLFSSERYESFNHPFRLASVHSNRQAPSRDIAKTFAGFDRLKHIATGGFWISTGTKQPKRASKQIMTTVMSSPQFARLIGLHSKHNVVAGSVIKTSSNQPVQWHTTAASRSEYIGSRYALNTLVQVNLSFNTISGDKANIADCIVFETGQDSLSRFVLGLIKSTVSAVDNQSVNETLVEVATALFLRQHTLLDLPILIWTGNTNFIKSTQVHGVVNIQHNCATGSCAPHDARQVLQERELTTQYQEIIRHSDNGQWILNTLALHNHSTIMKALPLRFRNASSVTLDSGSLRRQAAAQLRAQKGEGSEIL